MILVKSVEIACTEDKGEQAQLTINDIGNLICGGEIKISDGTTIILEGSFLKLFTSRHIQVACKKCGYCPTT